MQPHPILQEIDNLNCLPPNLRSLLNKPEGAAVLASKLGSAFPARALVEANAPERRTWELIGLFYMNPDYLQRVRYHEALGIFDSLCNQIFAAQDDTGKWYSKGTPLVWMSECYSRMGYSSIAQRHLMLTLIEDAIGSGGTISPESVGSYFRLVWSGLLTDAEFNRYAAEAHLLYQGDPVAARFPEWILQQLDREWVSQAPTPQEAGLFVANRRYLNSLIAGLGDRTGKSLEMIADYVLSCMPGCRAAANLTSLSSEYDVVCSMDGFEIDFRSELGRYFVCECKDRAGPADVTTIAKFCRVLDSVKARFGILFSTKGVSGQGKQRDAEREQYKVFQDRGIVIVAIDRSDLARVAAGENFVSLLRIKYEQIRLDLGSRHATRRAKKRGSVGATVRRSR